MRHIRSVVLVSFQTLTCTTQLEHKYLHRTYMRHVVLNQALASFWICNFKNCYFKMFRLFRVLYNQPVLNCTETISSITLTLVFNGYSFRNIFYDILGSFVLKKLYLQKETKREFNNKLECTALIYANIVFKST